MTNNETEVGSAEIRPMLTLKQVAELTQLSYSVILQAVQNPSSGLKASDLSAISGAQKRQWRVSHENLEAWIEARSNGAGRPSTRRRQKKRDEAVTKFY